MVDKLTSEDVRNLLRNIKPEERDKLKSCRQTGFMAGCAWGITINTMRHLAARFNILGPPTKAGSVTTFLVSFILGFVAYAPFCTSNVILEMANKRKNSEKNEQSSTTELSVPTDEYRNFQSTLNPDLDGPDSSFSHLSLNYAPNLTDNLILQEGENAKPKFRTYEDLRKQNRENFKNLPPEGTTNLPLQPDKQLTSKPEETPKRIKTNKYGDPVDD